MASKLILTALAALAMTGGAAQAQNLVASVKEIARGDLAKTAVADKAGFWNDAHTPAFSNEVSAVVNVEGVKAGRLKLTGPVLADIYLGNITRWDAPQIASLNPGVALPHSPITVVHRSDPSQASQSFTGFLAAQSSTFKNEVGSSPAAAFPVGVGRTGDDGVADVVAKTPGSIGYVDWSFAKTSGLSTARLIDGKTMPVRAFAAPAAAGPSMADTAKPAAFFNAAH